MNDQASAQDQYNELACYTLVHTNPTFIHQHIVDAFGAQHADEQDKPIRPAFALLGLYLYIEKGYTGKQVQRAHTLLAEKRKRWPTLDLPVRRGDVTIA